MARIDWSFLGVLVLVSGVFGVAFLLAGGGEAQGDPAGAFVDAPTFDMDDDALLRSGDPPLAPNP